MGKQFLDVYSITHVLAGIIFEKMGLSFCDANVLHLFYELFVNYFLLPVFGGIRIKLPYVTLPEIKNLPDSTINSIGDQLTFILGFLIGRHCLSNKYYLPKWTIVFIPLVPIVLSFTFTQIIGRNFDDEYDNSRPTGLQLEL